MTLISTKAKMIFTITVFVVLAAFDNIIIGLFPPLFKYIGEDLHIGTPKLVTVSSFNILVTAISSVYWGYLSGKFKRKKLVIIGTCIWIVSVFLTATSKNYIQLLFFQMLTGVGLGCIASIGFSILTDYIPHGKRGVILSLWGMAQGLGGIAGSLLASLTTTNHNWRFPFEIIGFIGFFLIFFYLFVEEPTRGQSDPELRNLVEKGMAYHYRIETKQIKEILLKKSNLLLFFQAFFLNISTGSLIYIPTLFIFKIEQQGYSEATAVIASGYLYGIFQLGGMTSAYFGHLGDKFQKNTYKGRAVLTSFFVFLTMPLYIVMFSIPIHRLVLPKDDNAIAILFQLVEQILLNPWMAAVFLLSLLASAAQSANTPNWLALITDVNFPEHRGTAFSVANLFNSLGRTIGTLGVAILVGVISFWYKEPTNYAITLSALQLFLIPSAICYLFMTKSNVSDIHNMKESLKIRINELEEEPY